MFVHRPGRYYRDVVEIEGVKKRTVVSEAQAYRKFVYPNSRGECIEPTPGTSVTRSLVVNAESVRKFVEFTGDYNSHHFDEEFVSGTRFGRLLAQRSITTGLLHALVAMGLPGPGSVFMSQRWLSPKPMYAGDTITASGT